MASKAALVIGASRGIGRQIALTLANNGYKVGVAAKTIEHSTKTPGTIYSVTQEITDAGGSAMPIICNVRDISHIDQSVQNCIQQFGQLDVVIYNAGAVLWESVIETPLKKFDLMHEVNVRGAYAMVQSVLPEFVNRRQGHIIVVAPPIYNR